MVTAGMGQIESPQILGLKNRLIVDGHAGDFSANLFINDAHFFPFYQYRWQVESSPITRTGTIEKVPIDQVVEIPDDTIELEKLSVSYNDSNGVISAQAGDFYSVIARGLALSLRRRDLEGEDTTLRGAKGSVSFPSQPITYQRTYRSRSSRSGSSWHHRASHR